MSGARTLVSIDEYLHTIYEPDCDYVDGELEDRNVGEKDHSKMQAAFLVYFHQRRKQWGIYVAIQTFAFSRDRNRMSRSSRVRLFCALRCSRPKIASAACNAGSTIL
jgi:hypothetical protein